jgi:CheY-like chemotaxis protein
MAENVHPSAPSPLVLVVEDFPDSRDMYVEYLELAGYRAACARNGEEGVALAQALCPDVVVMDLSLPVLDGWEATRILKSDERTKAIWIIAVTGHGERHYVDRAQAAGVDYLLLKPLGPDDLARMVASCIARGARRRRPET